jgi:hypothetical protein
MKTNEEVEKSLDESFDEQLNLSELEDVEGGASEKVYNTVANCSTNNCNGGNCVANCGVEISDKI